MSVKEAVQFRFLASQLTSQEINRFLFNLSDKQPSLLMSALCHHFMSDSTMVRTINGTISDIITTRKPKLPNAILDIVHTAELPSDPTPNPVHFNDIPIPVVSIISSFMNQREYSKFSRTNRFTFLGCHSPNTLRRISSIAEADYQNPFKCQLYPNVRHLSIKVSDLDPLSRRWLSDISHPSFLAQLESVDVNAHECWQEHSTFMDKANTELFAERLPYCRNVKELSCVGFNTTNCIDVDVLHDTLSCFPNTEYLTLSGGFTVDRDHISSTLPSLKGLSIEPNNKHLIRIFADQLEFLELNGPGGDCRSIEMRPDYNYDKLNNIDFAKLKQFKLGGASVASESFDNIMETAHNLRKLSVFHVPHPYRTTMEKAMKKRCASLEYIHLSGYRDVLGEAVIGITNGIRTARKKTNLKIEINVIWRTGELEVFLRSMSSLINTLQNKTKNFMLIWRVGGPMVIFGFGKEDINETSQQLEKTLNESIVIKVENTLIVAMNKNCTINDGYQESWACHE
eukprot:379103_1